MNDAIEEIMAMFAQCTIPEKLMAIEFLKNLLRKDDEP